MGLSSRVKIDGLKSLQDKLKAMPERARLELDRAVIEAGFNIHAAAVRSIQKSPADPVTGRSKPGNPPKTDTGRLASSIYVKVEDTKDGAKVTVGTDVVYGRRLEFGTSNIAARPWLFPAAEQNKRRNMDLIVKRMRAFVKKQGGK